MNSRPRDNFTRRGSLLTTPQSRLLNAQTSPAIEAARGADPARARGSSIFTDHLPSYVVKGAGFHMISVAAPVIAAGHSAWYGLRRIRFEKDFPEAQLVGYRMTMMPTNPSATTVSGVNGMAWGGRTGTTAAVVIGQNLTHVTPGQWSSAAAYIPAIESASSPSPAHTQLFGIDESIPEYIAVESFPTGDYADTTPNKITPARTFAPFVFTFRSGTTLDVALVVSRQHINGQNGTIIGMVDVRMVLSPIDGAITGRGTQ